MAERAAIARPYADAAFAVAAGDAGRIDAWAAFLARAAVVVRDERVAQLLNNPHADKPRLGTVDAELVAAFAVGDEQQSAVAEALSHKLGRRVRLSAREDRGLIGGAIVRAGDLVIDASVRGQLQQLAAALDA